MASKSKLHQYGSFSITDVEATTALKEIEDGIVEFILPRLNYFCKVGFRPYPSFIQVWGVTFSNGCPESTGWAAALDRVYFEGSKSPKDKLQEYESLAKEIYGELDKSFGNIAVVLALFLALIAPSLNYKPQYASSVPHTWSVLLAYANQMACFTFLVCTLVAILVARTIMNALGRFPGRRIVFMCKHFRFLAITPSTILLAANFLSLLPLSNSLLYGSYYWLIGGIPIVGLHVFVQYSVLPAIYDAFKLQQRRVVTVFQRRGLLDIKGNDDSFQSDLATLLPAAAVGV